MYIYVCLCVYVSGKYIVLKYCVIIIINPLNFINYEDTGMF